MYLSILHLIGTVDHAF
jgi:hypothetical protein